MHRPQQAGWAVSTISLYAATAAVIKVALPVAKAAALALLLSVAIPLVILAGLCSAVTEQLCHCFPDLAPSLSKALNHSRRALVTKLVKTLSAPAILRAFSAGVRCVTAAVREPSWTAVCRHAGNALKVSLITAGVVVLAAVVSFAVHLAIVAVSTLMLAVMPEDEAMEAYMRFTMCTTPACQLTTAIENAALAVWYIAAVVRHAAAIACITAALVRHAATIGCLATIWRAEYHAAVSLQAYLLRVVALLSHGTSLLVIVIVTTLKLCLEAVIALLKQLEVLLEEVSAASQGSAGTTPQGSTGTASADTGSAGTASQGTARSRPSPIYSYYGHRPPHPKEQPRHQRREQPSPRRSRAEPSVPNDTRDTYRRDQSAPQTDMPIKPATTSWQDTAAARKAPTVKVTPTASAAKPTTGSSFVTSTTLLDDWQPHQQQFGQAMQSSTAWPDEGLPEQVSVLLKHSRSVVRATMLCQLDLALLDVSQAAAKHLQQTAARRLMQVHLQVPSSLTMAHAEFRSCHTALTKLCSRSNTTVAEVYQHVTNQLKSYNLAKQRLQAALSSTVPVKQLSKAVQQAYSTRAKALPLPKFQPTWSPDARRF